MACRSRPRMADGDDLDGARDVDLLHGDGYAEHDRLEGKLEVLLDGRMESDGLFGLRVRVDDGLVDHRVESVRRDSSARGGMSLLLWRRLPFLVIPSFLFGDAPRRALKCSEALWLQSLFQVASTCWLERSEGKPFEWQGLCQGRERE